MCVCVCVCVWGVGGGGQCWSHRASAHSSVVEDDITAAHVAMENMFLKMLYQCTLRGHEQTAMEVLIKQNRNKFTIEVGLLLSNLNKIG